MYPNKRQLKSPGSLVEKRAKTNGKICRACNVSKPEPCFSKTQWKGDKNGRKCIDCIEIQKKRIAMQEKICSTCKIPKLKPSYSKKHWNDRSGGTCIDCIETRKKIAMSKTCSKCHVLKPKSRFTKGQYKTSRVCIDCFETERGNLPCSKCQQYFSDDYYTESKKLFGSSSLLCRSCVRQEDLECSTCHNVVKGYSFPCSELESGKNPRCRKCLKTNKLFCSLCEKKVKLWDFQKEEVDNTDQDRQCTNCKFLFCGVCHETRPRCEFQPEELLKTRIENFGGCEYSLMMERKQKQRICNDCQNCPFCWACELKYSPCQFEKNGDYFSSLCVNCLARKRARLQLRDRDDLIFGVRQVKMPTFQIPGTDPVWSLDSTDANERSPPFSFGKLDLLRLLQTKTYELIFFYTSCSDHQYRLNRATKGTLTFRFDDGLKAVLSVDKSVRVGLRNYHSKDIEMEIFKYSYSNYDGVTNKDRITLSITNKESLEEDWQSEMDDIEGTIQLISKRQAVRHMPECHDFLDHTNYIRQQFSKSIKIQNNEEAEKLLEVYDEGKRIMWLENHLNLPKEMTKIIHTYLSEKPPPAFFFEENDILLGIEWGRSRDARISSGCCVARPVEEDGPILEDMDECIVEKFVFDVEQTFANYYGDYPCDLLKEWVREHPAIRNVEMIGSSIIETITSTKQIDCLMRDVIFEIVELGAVATKQCYLNLLSTTGESECRKELLICFICSGYFPLEYNDRKMLDVLAEDKVFSDDYYPALVRIVLIFEGKIGGFEINFKTISADQIQRCKKNLPQLTAGITHDRDGPFAQCLREMGHWK
ncbi:predicted protein [Chaetoceros tenuissimus]|uniref:Uncharacterized protein n=1 Tax=Chaetoceros tenuissimus TaxID=426638 RepID=A0AAD3CHA2_9STRA|nr:predicted protein [Chaetoceros tenuissimus]